MPNGRLDLLICREGGLKKGNCFYYLYIFIQLIFYTFYAFPFQKKKKKKIKKSNNLISMINILIYILSRNSKYVINVNK